MKVPFLDLKAINNRFNISFLDSFDQFLEGGYYILGNELKSFEKEFASYCGTKYAYGVGNGYDALYLILRGYMALGKLREGDEVIVPSNTFIATILSVVNAGLKPIMVEPDTKFNIDVELVENQVNVKTKALIATHLYGQMASTTVLSEICHRNNLLFITDAAQAHGAENKNGERAGGLSDAAAFSFYPSKNLGALGDGGAITTNDDDLADYIAQYRNYGSYKKYHHDTIGVNSRLDELQACFLNNKLKILDDDNERRRQVASRYIKGIDNPGIVLPDWDGTKNHVFHLFVIQCEKRDLLQQFLETKGIQTQIHYPIPIHKQKCFINTFKEMSFKKTEKLSSTVLSLPISPVMTDQEVEYVIKILNSFN